ncbi:hypothetical protein HDV05_004819 [Chytridiales sp. JEL 0842]|nr:hypothetical protein HDV05_004819 [Chytridiales sp. JEL 0842]
MYNNNNNNNQNQYQQYNMYGGSNPNQNYNNMPPNYNNNNYNYSNMQQQNSYINMQQQQQGYQNMGGGGGGYNSNSNLHKSHSNDRLRQSGSNELLSSAGAPSGGPGAGWGMKAAGTTTFAKSESSGSLKQIPLTCTGHTRPVVDLCFSGFIHTGDYFLISACKAHKGAVWSSRLTRDASLSVTGSADFTAKVWNNVTGQPIATFPHKHVVRVVDISDDGRYVLTGGLEKKVRVFDMQMQGMTNPDSKDGPEPIRCLEGNSNDVKCALLDAVHGLVFNGDGKELRVWDLRQSTQVSSRMFDNDLTSLKFSWDKKYIICTAGKKVFYYNAITAALEKSFDVSVDVSSASLHPDGSKFIVGGSNDLWVRVYDFATGKEMEVYKGHHGPIHCVSYSPDGELYATGSEDGTEWCYLKGDPVHNGVEGSPFCVRKMTSSDDESGKGLRPPSSGDTLSSAPAHSPQSSELSSNATALQVSEVALKPPIWSTPTEKRTLAQKWNHKVVDLLLGSSALGNLERIARTLAFIEVSDPTVPSAARFFDGQIDTQGRCQGLVYLRDPFEGMWLNGILNSIDPSKLTWESIFKILFGHGGHVANGWDSLLRSPKEQVEPNAAEAKTEDGDTDSSSSEPTETDTLGAESAEELFTEAPASEDYDRKPATEPKPKQVPEPPPIPLTTSQKADLECLALTLLYIAWFAPLECDRGALQATFGELISRICDPANLLKPIQSLLPDGTWGLVFRKKNLRFHSRTLNFKYVPSMTTVFWNELFEYWRLSQLSADGYLQSVEKVPDKRMLGEALSASFHTVLEYSEFSDYIVSENLRVLSSYAAHLPVSWYTTEFVQRLCQISQTIMHRVDQLPRHDAAAFLADVVHFQTLCSVAQLLDAWFRKQGSTLAQSVDLATNGAFCLFEMYRRAVEYCGGSEALVLPIISGLCASFGKVSDAIDDMAMKVLTETIVNIKRHLSPQGQDSVIVAAAQVMKLVPSKQIGQLALALLKSSDTVSGDQTAPFAFTLDQGFRFMYLFEHIAGSKWDSMESSLFKNAETNRGLFAWLFGAQKKAETPLPAWWTALRISLGDSMEWLRSNQNANLISVIFAYLGLLRFSYVRLEPVETPNAARPSADVKETQPPRLPRKVVESLEVEAMEFLKRAAVYLQEGHVAEASKGNVRRAIAYGTSFLLSSGNEELLRFESDSYKPLLTTVLQALFDDSLLLNLGSEFFQTLSTSADSQLSHVTTLLSTRLSKSSNSGTPLSLFQAEIPRLSRSVGHLLTYAWKQGDGECVEQAVRYCMQFSEKLYNDWEECGIGERQDQTAVECTKALFGHFRLCLFSVTLIFKSVLEAIEDVPPLTAYELETERQMRQLVASEGRSAKRLPTSTGPSASRIAAGILKAFGDLHFVTCRFGADGFKTWNGVFGSAVEMLKDAAKGDVGGSDVERADVIIKPVDLVMGLLEADGAKSQGRVEYTTIRKSRLLYNLFLIQRTATSIPESLLTSQVLPLLFPYLHYYTMPKDTRVTPSADDKDLFELSHELLVIVFQHVHKFKRLVEDFAPWYADLLIKNYPEPIDLDLFRRSFSYMIKALSSLSAPNTDNSELLITSEGVDPLEDIDEEDAPVEDGDMQESEAGQAFVDSTLGGRTSWRGFRWTQRKKKPKKKQDLLESATFEGDSTEWKGDEIAWICIQRLVNEINRLSSNIQDFESKNPVSNFSKTDTVQAPNLSSSPSDRLGEILNSAPSVKWRMHREQLCAILFDQIRHVGLRGLHPLLDSIRFLMLGEYADGQPPSLRLEFAQDDNGDTTTSSDEAKSQLKASRVPTNKDELLALLWRRKSVVGLESDPDTSMLWKSLVSSVGFSQGFDYLRRNQCVSWYLDLQKDAKDAQVDIEKWERKLGHDAGRLVDKGKTSEHADGLKGVPFGHPLRAKL